MINFKGQLFAEIYDCTTNLTKKEIHHVKKTSKPKKKQKLVEI